MEKLAGGIILLCHLKNFLVRMTEICNLLELRILPDYLEIPGGWFAVKQLRLGLERRWVSVNDPVDARHHAKLLTFAEPVPSKTVLDLFELTNGVSVASNKFVTFGVLDEKGGADFASIPLDINVPNVYERPSTISNAALIVGAGVNHHTDKASLQEVVHYMDEHGSIHVSPEDDCNCKLVSYVTVEDWLKQEFYLAVRKHLMIGH